MCKSHSPITCKFKNIVFLFLCRQWEAYNLITLASPLQLSTDRDFQKKDPVGRDIVFRNIPLSIYVTLRRRKLTVPFEMCSGRQRQWTGREEAGKFKCQWQLRISDSGGQYLHSLTWNPSTPYHSYLPPQAYYLRCHRSPSPPFGCEWQGSIRLTIAAGHVSSPPLTPPWPSGKTIPFLADREVWGDTPLRALPKSVS